MELATLRTLYFANLYRERALKSRVAEIIRAIESGDGERRPTLERGVE